MEEIVHKVIRVSAVDEVTRPLAEMNQRIRTLEAALSEMAGKFTQSTSGQSAFRSALEQTKASANETSESLKKINATVERIKSPKVIKADADTKPAETKLDKLASEAAQLGKKSPKIKPEVDSAPAEHGLSRLKSAFSNTAKAGSRLKDFVAGGILAQGITSLGGSMAQMAKEGFEAAKAGQETAEKWHNIGMTKSDIKAAGDAVRDLKENSMLSGAAASNMITRFYGLTGSTEKAQELAHGVGSIADQMKMTTEQADSFANGLTRIEASGKVSAQSLGRLEKTAPGLTAALQQASGMSKKAFDDLLSSGKMTSDQFNDILSKASGNWKKYSEEWAKTPDGALHHIQQVWYDTKKTLMAPLVSVSATGLDALSKALSSPAVTQAITQLGQGLANVAKSTAEWLTPKHVSDLTHVVSDIVTIGSAIAKSAWKTFQTIIEAIAKPFEKIGGSKSGDSMDHFAKAMDAITHNKAAMTIISGIGSALATYFVASKLLAAADGLNKLYKGLVQIGSLGTLSSKGNIFKDVGALGSKIFDKATLTKSAQDGADAASQEFATRMERNVSKTNSKGWFKNLFSGSTTAAETAGAEAGASFSSRMAAKATAGSTWLAVGKGIAGKLGTGLVAGLGAVDLARGLTPSFQGDKMKMIGKGAGALIGAGIGFMLGGPVGATVGGTVGHFLGGTIAKGVVGALKGAFNVGYTLGELLTGKISFSSLADKFKKTMSNAFKSVGDAWNNVVKWWNGEPTKGSSSKSKQPSKEAVESLGGNNYSKADIANVKAMNKAITAYTNSLKKLKDAVKHNDPTKEINSMNKGLTSATKSWSKLSKPLNDVSKDFTSFGKSSKTMASSIKSLTGKNGVSSFAKDLKSLEKELKSSKLDKYFDDLAKSLKKSKLADEFKQMAKYMKDTVKEWKQFVTPVKDVTKYMEAFVKMMKDFGTKKDPLYNLDEDIQKLDKTAKKSQFGKELANQMSIANKEMSGKHSFVSEFSNITKQLEKDLASFKRAFSKDWESTWKGLDSPVKRALATVYDVADGRLENILRDERSFTGAFMKSWNSWIDDVKSSFRSGFNKLPEYATSAMKDIVSRLNRGISGINSVISQFGGDKHLSTISYATGTFAPHPGGKAVLNDGNAPQKQELVWEPSRGFSFPQGQYTVHDLEKGAMVFNAGQVQSLKRGAGLFPHYAGGTLSDEEMEKIGEAFENNPKAASKDLVLKMTNWNSNVPVVSDLGKSIAVAFSQGIANVLKDLLGEVKEPINGDWTPVIRSAAAHMHVTLSAGQIGKLLRQIQTESGGNEHITQQVQDVNSAAGNPAKGLLQFIPQTFNTWALPGHHNIFSGFDQIMAAINALNHGGEGGWGNIGNGHGWASGGHITSMMRGWVGDNPERDEYVINPYNSNALPLIEQAYQSATMNRPELRSSVPSGSNSQLVALVRAAVEKLDNIDIHPQVAVRDIASSVNKHNAKEWALLN